MTPKVMAGAESNVAVAMPEASGVTQPEGRLPKLTALELVCTVASAPTPPERSGLSPTKPLMRHWPLRPVPIPEMRTELRPRVTTGWKLPLAK
jgi:hypothetical protein